MEDRFIAHSASIVGPANHSFPINPHDASPLTEVTRAIYVGGGGSLRLVMQSGATVDFAGIIGGTILPVRVSAVLQSGTTATGLVALV